MRPPAGVSLPGCTCPPQGFEVVYSSSGKQWSLKHCADAVYKVCVGRFPRCTCPDFAKGNICKHYLVRDIGQRPFPEC